MKRFIIVLYALSEVVVPIEAALTTSHTFFLVQKFQLAFNERVSFCFRVKSRFQGILNKKIVYTLQVLAFFRSFIKERLIVLERLTAWTKLV